MENDAQPESLPSRPRGGSVTPRSYTLGAMLVLAALLFVTLFFLNRSFVRLRRRIGQEQFARGLQAMSGMRPAEAAESFQNALRFSPGNAQYQLRLAQALGGVGKLAQAEAYLDNLLQQEPGDGTVNLERARLAVRAHDMQNARRYFNAAIYGAWPENGSTMRRAARLELVRALLADRDLTGARSELMGLIGDLPDDPAVLAETAGLFLAAGDNEYALRLFRRALSSGAAEPQWRRGAGLAAYRLGRYPEAKEFLRQALDAGADGDAAETLRVADAVLDLDPYTRGLPHAAHATRAFRIFMMAGARIDDCPQPAILPPSAERWSALKPKVSQRALLRDPELLDAALDVAFHIYQENESCRARSPEDSALTLLARRYATQAR